MFDRFQKFLHSLSLDGGRDDRNRHDDPRVAAAALFYHVIDADGIVSESERNQLRTLLQAEYDIHGRELDALMAAGQRADEEAVDLYGFTSILKRNLEASQRLKLIELLWELAYADGERHELEDHIVWRIAELLGVSDRDRIVLRQNVADRTGGTIGTDEGKT